MTFTELEIAELEKELDPFLIRQRKGGSNKILEYIKGHTAIDQANRIFGYGGWGYRTVSCEQVILIDPLTGEAVGVEYKAVVEVTVHGTAITDIGSQPVATWNVEDQIMQRRASDAENKKKPLDESPFSWLEKKNARAVITEAHEQAKKGAVTDAMKRSLRAFGNQFGNALYGHVQPEKKKPQPSKAAESVPAPEKARPEPPITDEQYAGVVKVCQGLGRPQPDNLRSMTAVDATSLLVRLTEEHKLLVIAKRAWLAIHAEPLATAKERWHAYLVRLFGGVPVVFGQEQLDAINADLGKQKAAS